MNTSTQTIYVDHSWNSEYNKQINPQLQGQIPVSCKEMKGAYTVFQISQELYLIHIHDTDDNVVVPRPDQSSILLHVHIIERQCLCLNSESDEYGEVVDGIRFLCIFNDMIVEISLETSFFQHLGNQEVGFSLKGFTEFPFSTTYTELLSFAINECDRTESLKVCSILGQQASLFQLNFLGNADEEGCIFNVIKETFFVLPPTISVIEIYCNSNFFVLRSKLRTTQSQFQICIYDGESNVLDDEASPTFILSHFDKRCILVKKHQLCKFQCRGFQIIATMYLVFPCDEDEEILKKIQRELLLEFLKLNMYRRLGDDSDLDSGDDLYSDSD